MSISNGAYPEVRIMRLKEQVAHLKVLASSAEKDVLDAQRNLTAWTERLMVYEAIVSVNWFRVNDYEAEIERLKEGIAAKAKRKRRA